MSGLSKTIDAIIAESLHPLLRTRGFKKKSRTFIKDAGIKGDGAYVLVINVQASSFNYDGEGRYTVNLGVYYPRVAEVSGALPIKGGFPKEYDCTVRERIGALMPGGQDHWWQVREGQDIHKAGIDLSEAVRQYGLEWFGTVSDIKRLRRRLRQEDNLKAAASICLMEGEREEAARLIRQSIREHPRSAAHHIQWADKHSLDIG